MAVPAMVLYDLSSTATQQIQQFIFINTVIQFRISAHFLKVFIPLHVPIRNIRDPLLPG